MQFLSKVENGHISDACRKTIAQTIKSLNGKLIKITIEEKKKNRSLSQNNYYWGVVIPAIKIMFDEYGNNISNEQVHEFLKLEVGNLRDTITLPNGDVTVITGSSAGLKTLEFESYLTKIRAWAAEWDVFIPLPNEVL